MTSRPLTAKSARGIDLVMVCTRFLRPPLFYAGRDHARAPCAQRGRSRNNVISSVRSTSPTSAASSIRKAEMVMCRSMYVFNNLLPWRHTGVNHSPIATVWPPSGQFRYQVKPDPQLLEVSILTKSSSTIKLRTLLRYDFSNVVLPHTARQ